ncbi:MAG: hypothetical protein Q9218_004410 [Villophora microphyllina]
MNQEQMLQALLNGLSRYSIQNLTINSYGPLTILSDKPNMSSTPQNNAPETHVTPTKGTDGVTPQWSWATAHVKLKNDLQGTLSRVTVRHQRGDTVTDKTWYNVNPGDTTDIFSTDFQHGFYSDYDHWQIELQLENGGPVENRFSAAATDIELRHNHEGYPMRTKHWDTPTPQGQNTSSWPVYFVTGDSSNDLWDIAVMRKGDKKPHINAKKDKGCWLQAPDNGRIVKVIVRNDGWTMAFPSGSCDDYWDWAPNANRANKIADVSDDEWTEDI